MQVRKLGKMTYAAILHLCLLSFIFFPVLLLYIEGNAILCSVSELNLHILLM